MNWFKKIIKVSGKVAETAVEAQALMLALQRLQQQVHQLNPNRVTPGDIFAVSDSIAEIIRDLDRVRR